jgi:UDP-4-amino-4,6-dideoxy-N-acetyl-beta-L-altrosamine transaminase|tara:strand:+ start:8466 stop:9653 length:1188 start_codon:yes stop_codon:yes gene_type:complete
MTKRYLPYSRQNIDSSDIKKIVDVLKSDFITQGPNIVDFEKDFAKFVGAKYAVACATGTAALHLSCLALGINKKSKILTSAVTFVASANCAEFLGAKVDFVDIDKKTYCISVSELEKKLKKSKIDLVIPVHMCGHSSDMAEIHKLKKKYNFHIIEDSCHALGGTYNNFKVGSCKYSDISTFSFHPVKPITTAEGGMITTNNKIIYQKLLLYRTHGIHKNPKAFKHKSLAFDKNNQPNRWYYEMDVLGFNYRMTDLQAALGKSQLKRIKLFTKRRNQIASIYNKSFKNLEYIKTPYKSKKVVHAYHLYTILINFKKIKTTKNNFMKLLAENGIGSQVLYIPVFLQPYYKRKYNYNAKNFPQSMKYYDQALSIPVFYGLSKIEQALVIRKVIKLLNN